MLVYIVDRIGPYHHARFVSLAASPDFSGPLVVLELFGRDVVYAWDQIPVTQDYRRITITDNEPRNLMQRFRFSRRLFQILNELDPDHVAIPGWRLGPSFAATLWRCKRNAKAILLSDSTAADKSRNRIYEWIKSRILQNFHAAFVAGRRQKNYLEGLGFDGRAIFQGYDVVDNQHFERDTREAVGEGRPGCFLTLCRFVEKKNLCRLIEAYGKYRQQTEGSPWTLKLVGDGPLRLTLEAKIRECHLGDSVILSGFAQYDELPLHYGNADVFVLPSTTEQWGLVINEAMASGMAVLVSNRCGCADDLVEEGVNGYTFDPQDTDELAELMERMTAVTEVTRAMGRKSRQKIAAWGLDRFNTGIADAMQCSDSAVVRNQWQNTLVVYFLFLASLLIDTSE